MAIKKSEPYSSLWKPCDELRGGMDTSQYKDYALVLLCVKYVSGKYVQDQAQLCYISNNTTRPYDKEQCSVKAG
ncbi:hypothetical protein D9M70_566290 [compost metagenome]